VILLVAPFVAPGVDPDALGVARFATADAAAALDVPGVEVLRLADEIEISPGALKSAAEALHADAALGATIALDSGEIAVDAALSTGAEFSDRIPLGQLPQLGTMLARAMLLALGEDAAAPAAVIEADIDPGVALRLASAAARLEEDEPEEMLALDLRKARRLLLDWAAASPGTPETHAALEQLCEAHAEDGEALLLLARSRALLLDEAGARELYLQARDEAPDAETEAAALSGLAALAEEAGRDDEAVLHLRAAVKLVDDPSLYLRLSKLVPAESVALLTRASVLSPDDPELHLQLAETLRPIDPQRALLAASEAARLSEDDPDLAARVRASIESIFASQG
jgi:tetratricopeptide (TPR) repeat protein